MSCVPSVAATTALLLVSVATVVAKGEEAYRASERDQKAMENYLTPVLTPLGGAGRVYIVTNCGRNDCPQFPRIRMQAASKGKTGLAAFAKPAAGAGASAPATGRRANP